MKSIPFFSQTDSHDDQGIKCVYYVFMIEFWGYFHKSLKRHSEKIIVEIQISEILLWMIRDMVSGDITHYKNRQGFCSVPS